MKLVKTGVSMAVLAAATWSLTGAAAQEGATDVIRDRILVEGTKKAEGEDVQAVPIAVTAFGEDQLDALFYRDLFSLSYAIPNVQFEDIGTTPGTANFVIRGIGVNSSIPSIDPAVATVVDGVPLAINFGVVFDDFDLEAVEVLRGPQGTLFGRNATAGAVVLRTTDPTDEFEVNAKASVETGLKYTGSGRVSGPIIDGLLQGKIAAFYSTDEGYWDNVIEEVPAIPGVFPGIPGSVQEDIGGRDTFLFRPALRLTPNDDFEIITKFEYGEITGDPNPAQNRGLNGDSFDSSVNLEGAFFEAEWVQLTNEVNWNVPFGEGVITNITGYRDYESDTFGDIDASPLFVFHAFNATTHEQFSNELRYSGRFFDRADFTAGIFYLDDTLTYIEDREIPSTPLPFIGGGEQDRQTLGIFAQTDISVTDQLIVTLGGRYNNEEKEFKVERTFSDADCTRDGCTSFDTEEPGGFDPDFFDPNPTYDNFSPRVGLQYFVNDEFQVYASYAEAVRAGGTNFRNTAPLAPFITTDDEKNQAFEIGFKSQLFDNRVTLNAAAFQYELSDLQREVNTSDPVAGVVQQIVNTADATVQGIEAEFQAIATDNLIFTGHIGLTDGEYDEVLFDLTGDDGVINERDLALDLPRLAPQTYGLGVIYDQSLGDLGLVTARANINHRSRAKYTDNNLGTFPSADILDASLTYTPGDGDWRFSFYGKNLLDEISFGNDTQLPLNFPGSPVFPIPGLQGDGATFSPLNKGRIVGFEAQFTY